MVGCSNPSAWRSYQLDKLRLKIRVINIYFVQRDAWLDTTSEWAVWHDFRLGHLLKKILATGGGVGGRERRRG